jgi:hypothetical protein
VLLAQDLGVWPRSVCVTLGWMMSVVMMMESPGYMLRDAGSRLMMTCGGMLSVEMMGESPGCDACGFLVTSVNVVTSVDDRDAESVILTTPPISVQLPADPVIRDAPCPPTVISAPSITAPVRPLTVITVPACSTYDGLSCREIWLIEHGTMACRQDGGTRVRQQTVDYFPCTIA